jgi:hypothetical protein
MKGGGEERSRRKKGGRSQDCGPVAVERGSVNCGGRGEEGTEGEGEGWESRARQGGKGRGVFSGWICTFEVAASR